MNAGRVTLVITCLVVATLGVWFAVARWDDANRVATVASALGAVAAVGVAVWAATRTAGSSGDVRVAKTGQATAGAGGRAITGVSGHAPGRVRVERTGDAKAGGDGDAVTGAHFD